MDGGHVRLGGAATGGGGHGDRSTAQPHLGQEASPPS
jgi:hypothetical protein